VAQLGDYKNLINDLKTHINSKLPPIYEPRKILVLENDYLPINQHGKMA